MSKRPWPDDRQPSAEELLEWCRTGMTADVAPYLGRLLDRLNTDEDVLRRVRDLRDRWRHTAHYGNWHTAKDYGNRAELLTQALDGTLQQPVITPEPLTPEGA